MKSFKAFVFSAIMLSSQVNAVDIPKNLEWCSEQLVVLGGKLKAFGSDLTTDTTTQVVTLSSVITCIGCYNYYHYSAALACLDGHANGRIMHKSGLLYMSYPDFLRTIEPMNSYADVLEFINQYCTSCCCVSDAKINKFIALLNDLQANNNRQAGDNIENENAILEIFKNNFILAQANFKQEAINAAIAASENAHNAHALRVVLDIMSILLGGSK